MIDAADPRWDAFEALTDFWEEAGLEPLPALAPAAPAAASRTPAPPAATFEQHTLPPPPPARRRSDPVADARQLAASAGDLTQLAAAIAAFDGCPLKKGARHTVFADGVEGAPVMVIGMAPGTEDDEAGRPFLGPNGQLMDKMLSAIGLSRAANVYLTNVVFWRPPGGARIPTQGEIAACAPFVERAIQLARPKAIILAGEVAAEAVLKRGEGLMKLRGRRLKHGYPELTEPVNAMVMLDPLYLLKRPQEKALAWADLLAFEAWLAELGVEVRRPM